jgi:acyl-CoA thioesterase
MTLEELQKQALKLPISDRWKLVQTLLKSLKQETPPKLKRGNLSRLRGIAKNSEVTDNVDSKENNWWLKVAGTLENDPTFDETVRLGQEWHKSVE